MYICMYIYIYIYYITIYIYICIHISNIRLLEYHCLSEEALHEALDCESEAHTLPRRQVTFQELSCNFLAVSLYSLVN